MILTGSLASLRCACGSADLASIQPGTEPLRLVPGGLPIDRGVPCVARCLSCLTRAFPAMKQPSEG